MSGMLDLLFSLAGALALSGWAALVILPGWRLTDRLTSLVIPAILAIAYVGLIAAFWGEAEGGFGSLQEVRALFDTPGLLLAGWLHYLAFDLFIGAWQVRTARAEGIPHLAIVPSLVLTFLFGPAGFLVFLVTRAVVRQRHLKEI